MLLTIYACTDIDNNNTWYEFTLCADFLYLPTTTLSKYYNPRKLTITPIWLKDYDTIEQMLATSEMDFTSACPEFFV